VPVLTLLAAIGALTAAIVVEATSWMGVGRVLVGVVVVLVSVMTGAVSVETTLVSLVCHRAVANA
jgi:hypothetical protein